MQHLCAVLMIRCSGDLLSIQKKKKLIRFEKWVKLLSGFDMDIHTLNLVLKSVMVFMEKCHLPNPTETGGFQGIQHL